MHNEFLKYSNITYTLLQVFNIFDCNSIQFHTGHHITLVLHQSIIALQAKGDIVEEIVVMLHI